jgi:hypothetical protein
MSWLIWTISAYVEYYDLSALTARAQASKWPSAGYIEQDFRKYLECGILAHGFARARLVDANYNQTASNQSETAEPISEFEFDQTVS